MMITFLTGIIQVDKLNMYYNNETNCTGNMIHPNPVKYLTNASPLHIPLLVLDHTLV